MNLLRSCALVMVGLVIGVAAGNGAGASPDRAHNELRRAAVMPGSFGPISGLAFDGNALWITPDGRPLIHRVDPDSGRITRTFPFVTGETGGSAWDGRTLWQLAYRERAIYRVDVQTGRSERAFASPGEGMCSGMTFDGRFLWVANFDSGRLFQIDQQAGGRVVRSIAGHVETSGLAWDGRYLWSGLVLGVKDHDDATAATGFVQQQDPFSEEALSALPLPGVGPGTSDWLPGRERATRFWWYDGFHDRVVVLTHRGSPRDGSRPTVLSWFMRAFVNRHGEDR